MATGVPARLRRDEARRFGLVVGAAFLVLGALLGWRGRPSASLAFGALGGTLILLGAILPRALVPVRRVWMGMAVVISRVTTPIFLAIVYFAVITPIGVLRRLVAHNPLTSRKTEPSLWVIRERRGQRPEDLEHQF